MQLNHIGPSQIEDLSDVKLCKLLDYLLKNEARKLKLEIEDLYVPERITTPDGGEDGRIVFKGATNRWLPNNITYYQCKSGASFSKEECAQEIEKKDPEGNTILKPKVLEVFERGGAYVLFMGYHPGAHQSIEIREEAIVEKVRELKQKNPDYNFDFEDDQVKVFDAKYIADWVNENISTVAIVKELLGEVRSDQILTWEQAKSLHPKLFEKEYKASDELSQLTVELREKLENDQVVRVIGYSGIGKTRFIFESFAPNETDEIQDILSKTFTYIDYDFNRENELKQLILNRTGYNGLLVIDNCPENFHETIAALVKANTNLYLITVDNDLSTKEDLFIKLTQGVQKDTCEKIIRDKLEGKIIEQEIDTIIEACESYPYFADYICKDIEKNGIENYNFDLGREEFRTGIINRLLIGTTPQRGIDEGKITDTAQGIAIYKKVPFIDDEFEEIASDEINKKVKEVRKFITEQVLDGRLTEHDFYRNSKWLKEERELIKRKGYYYSLIPELLAINLAADWLLNFPPDDLYGLVEEMKDYDILTDFCDRLKSLDQIPRAQTLVEKLWNPEGPFGNAEVLNTELGSRLFRSVVEVNPAICVSTLENTIGKFDINKLKHEVGPGRRNLVWALEKLVFRDDTFEKATTILLKFAVAENETNISNNATGQFCQLFHIHLPGTEVSLDRRLSLLRSLYDESLNTDYLSIYLKAIDAGLQYRHFTRTSFAEKQGTKVLNDYQPKTRKEIREYWEGLLDIWRTIFVEKEVLRSQALESIESHLRSFINLGLIGKVESLVNIITDTVEYTWDGAIRSLKDALRYDVVNPNDKEKINSLLSLLEPKQIKEQFRLKIVNPPYEHEKVEEGGGKTTYRDIAAENAEEFVEAFVNSKEDIEGYFELLLTGRPRFAFKFGKHFSDAADNIESTFYSAVEYYLGITNTNKNPEFLGGLFTYWDKDAKREILSVLKERYEAYDLILYLVKTMEPEYQDLKLLLSLAKENKLDVSSFDVFKYGTQLSSLSIKELAEFCDDLIQIEPIGFPVSVNIIYLHYLDKKDELEEIREDLISWYKNHNIFLLDDPNQVIEYYQWADLAKHLLESKDEPEFASSLTSQILEVSKKRINFGSAIYQKKALSILVENYFNVFWKNISPGLIDDTALLNLKEVLGSRNKPEMEEGVLFSNISEKEWDIIIEWCDSNKPEGPDRVALLMPCIRIEDGKYKWHPFTKKMIDTFGQQESFLRNISRNLGSYSWVGSIVPYYQNLKELVDSLKNHEHMEVREWAKKEKRIFEKNVKREKRREEELL